MTESVTITLEGELCRQTLMQGDCLERMKEIPAGSVDMVFSDLPYGTTNCKWDSVIPLNTYVEINGKVMYEDEVVLSLCKKGMNYKEAVDWFDAQSSVGLWDQVKRVLKPNGVAVLNAQTPFDKTLGASNLKMLKYEWIWEKTAATGHLNAKKMPMKAHENVLVFYNKLPTYNPQKTTGHSPVNSYVKKENSDGECYGKTKSSAGGGNTDRYPRSVQVFKSDKQKLSLHPTQKPLSLADYFIKTYTNQGDTVCDLTMGSGTYIVSAVENGRNAIGIEKDEDIFSSAVRRIKK